MANLSETDLWEAGIYQIEEDDPVLGGPSGITNMPPRQLANRTLYQRLRSITSWSADLKYPVSAYVQYGGKTWKSVAENTNVPPGTDASKWERWGHTVAEVSSSLGLTGSVAFFAFSTPPTGWLKANGATVSRTVYAELFAAIGTSFGLGDGINTFVIPDLRGEFIRGLDDSRGVDPARTLGSMQSDADRAHKHLTPVNDSAATQSMQIARGDSWTKGSASIGVPNCNLTTSGVIASGSGEDLWLYSGNDVYISGEARPRNIALMACIKF